LAKENTKVLMSLSSYVHLIKLVDTVTHESHGVYSVDGLAHKQRLTMCTTDLRRFRICMSYL
jgi:hypothetical protein